MKENEEKQKFIELRAEGLSYDKISKEIAVSKPTLMKWEKEFSQEIKELRNEKNKKNDIKRQLADAKRDYKEIGGWPSFKSGQWLWQIIQKSFANYWKNANVEYFESKYGTKDKAKIANKLISVTAKNSSILGGLTGAAISADEIVAISTGGEGGIGLPANIAIAAACIGGEAILLLRFQLQL